MTRKVIHVALNGVTGRMGYRQHLVRSLLAIREQGGGQLAGGSSLYPEPILVGRNEERLRAIAERHGLERWTTSVDEVLADPEVDVYFDTQVTSAREVALRNAIEAGKHVYTEKPVASSLDGALRLARAAKAAGITHGVVHDKLFLPGVMKLRLLGVRGGRDPGAAAVLELPCRRRRRDRARHVPALAVSADRLVRPGQRAVREDGHAHTAALGRVGQPLRRDRGRRRVRRARVRQRGVRLGELLLGGPGQPAGTARAPGGRHDGERGGRAARLRGAAPGVHADAGVEPRPARPDRLPGAVVGRAGQHELRQRVQGGVGAVPHVRLRGPAVRLGPGRGGQGGAAGEPGAAILGRRPAAPRAPAGPLTCRGWSLHGSSCRAGFLGPVRWSSPSRAGRPATPRRPAVRSSRPRTWRPRPGRTGTRSSTGSRPCASVSTCGRTGSAWPRRWTPRSAAWGCPGRRPGS